MTRDGRRQFFSWQWQRLGLSQHAASSFVATMETLGERNVYLYTLDNYQFIAKEPILEKDASVQARLERMRDEYQREGMRRTVEAVLLVHDHNHPHVLLLQLGTTFFKLPGGELRPGELETDGIRRIVTEFIMKDGAQPVDWECVGLVSNWWRPHFDAAQFPYIPPHIAKPKERRMMIMLQLPEKAVFHIPRNYRCALVPLFDLFDNGPTYGPVISTLPTALSRFNYIYL